MSYSFLLTLFSLEKGLGLLFPLHNAQFFLQLSPFRMTGLLAQGTHSQAFPENMQQRRAWSPFSLGHFPPTHRVKFMFGLPYWAIPGLGTRSCPQHLAQCFARSHAPNLFVDHLFLFL